MTTNLNDKNEQTLNYINQLQQQELSLYNSLDKSELSAEEKQMTINKINELSQIRLNLYGSIKDLLDTYNQNTKDSHDTLQQQVIAIKIMEDELENAKITLHKIDEEKATKIRLAEINTYYGKQYGAHKTLMKIIILFCIPVIILAVLRSWGLLPSMIYSFLVGIVILFGVIVIGYQLVDIYTRDNMNWDEYDWYFDPSKVSNGSTTDSTANNPWPEFNITCIGAECCVDGTIFDESINKCIIVGQQSTSTTSTDKQETDKQETDKQEAFTSLEKYAHMPVKTEGLTNNFLPKKALLSKYE
jgi:hypothetical protein